MLEKRTFDVATLGGDAGRMCSHSTKLVSVGAPRRSLPYHFIAKQPGPEHGVHEQLEVVARGVVAVEVDRAGVLEYPPHLQQPHRHHGQVGLHPLAVREPGGMEQVGYGGLLIGYEAHPSHVKVRERPSVLEGRSSRFGTHGGLIALVGVEGRV